MRLVAQAQTSRSRAQALADRAAFALTIIAIVAAVLTLVGWSLAGEAAGFVIERVPTSRWRRATSCSCGAILATSLASSL
jgi:P-type Cu2+ transporter